MAKKKVLEPETIKDDDAFGLGDSEGFYDDSMFDEDVSTTGELQYYAKTLMLPAADDTMSYLLHRESIGEIVIMRKDLFPMKEGFILAYIEYKVL